MNNINNEKIHFTQYFYNMTISILKKWRRLSFDHFDMIISEPPLWMNITH
jgi:hypothetical protein